MQKQLLITSGKGPQECNLAVQHTLQKMKDEAKRDSLTIEINSSKNDSGTICSIIISIEGNRMEEFVASWVGTIQWICSSPIRPTHKRKNWFIAVLRMEEKTDMDWNENEIQFETMRSSGAGGQHVNKVSSAVRAIYTPLQIAVQVMDTRSQLQNKEIAIQRLREKIKNLKQFEIASIANTNWLNQSQIQRGNPIRIFQGPKFKQKSQLTK